MARSSVDIGVVEKLTTLVESITNDRTALLHTLGLIRQLALHHSDDSGTEGMRRWGEVISLIDATLRRLQVPALGLLSCFCLAMASFDWTGVLCSALCPRCCGRGNSRLTTRTACRWRSIAC